ncbi:hypothetical protein ACKKBH_21405 [Aeromonas dhakensis]|uniref:hypothetical protein n=1 Tax=Aeromonas dhakensis TaxID=196024 RepID=UPI0038F77307
MGQDQQGHAEHETQQNKQKRANAPDGCQYGYYFVPSGLWFHKELLTARLHGPQKYSCWTSETTVFSRFYPQ